MPLILIYLSFSETFMRSTLADVDIKKRISTVTIPIFFEHLISRNVNKQVRMDHNMI